jgi:predicted  nucleic acid-binding Zn-ribbon protein
MVKKGVIGAALTAGALYLAFGTHAPSYVRTAFHKVRHTAKDSVPIQFDIERARDEIAALAPAIDNNKEDLARAEVDVEHLQREIATVRSNLETEKKQMVSLRECLTTGDFRLAGNVSYTPGEVRAELAGRLDHYRNVSRILEEKETTLHARQRAVASARQKLTEMATQKRALATKLESIQARLQAIEATQDRNEFNFDDSALSRAKQTVSDLERRLEVKARVAEMDGHFSGGTLPEAGESGRDVVKEFDDQFGSKAKETGDKSL